MSWKPELTKVYVVLRDFNDGDPTWITSIWTSRTAAEREAKTSYPDLHFTVEEHELQF